MRDDIGGSERARSDELTVEEADDLLVRIEQWMSVASNAVGWVYAPQSPFRKDKAGWKAGVGETLRSLANSVKDVMIRIIKVLGAASWSIGASFPWGISVGLSW